MAPRKKVEQTVITSAEAQTLEPMASEASNTALAPIAASNPIAVAAQQVVSLMTTALSNPKLDVRKMRDIMDLQMEAMRYQAEISFNRAMVECQSKIPQIETNKENTHTRSKYANLEAIDKIVRPIIAAHGFSLNFNTEQVDERHVRVICTVRHIDGHKEAFAMVGELDDGGFKGTANKTGIQAAGSSTSYLVRYLIKLAFHVVVIGEDKDGNAGKTQKPKDSFAARVDSERRRDERAAKAADAPEVEGFAVDAGVNSKRFKTLISAANYLRDLMKEMPDKQTRTDLLIDNKHILAALEAAAATSKVTELHAIANGE